MRDKLDKVRTWALTAALATAVAAPPALGEPTRGGVPAPAEVRRNGTATLSGLVTDARSRWAGSAIVTESTITADDGSAHQVIQLGGTVDGLGMWVSHTPPVLQPGQRVTARLRSARTSGGRAHWTLADAQVEVAAGTELGGALPFVRTTTSELKPVRWASGCAYIRYNRSGTSHVDGTSEFDIMNTAFYQWRFDARTCSYIDFVLEGTTDVGVGYDGDNVVVFRESSWCRPPTGNEPEMCYDSSAAGITTMFFVNSDGDPRNGEIVDADIELNAVDFAISIGGETRGEQSCQSDLTNTLTHEIGHLLGLDHTCWDGTEPRPVDEEGEPVPSCFGGELGEEVTDATMYNFQECGETKKSSPEADDIDGVCTIYPLEADPEQCGRADLPGGGCCAKLSAAGHRPADESRGAALLALLATLGGLLAFHTRRT